MLEAAVDGVFQERRVLWVVAADHETLGLDPVRRVERPTYGAAHSHSMVAGGFDVTSSTTRLTAGISFTIRDAITSIRS